MRTCPKIMERMQMNNFIETRLGEPYEDGMEWKINKRGNNGSINIFVLRSVDSESHYMEPCWVWVKIIPADQVASFMGWTQD